MWGYIVWFVILIIVMAMLVNLRSRYSIYVCPKCEARFTLSALKDFLFPQVMYRKLTRCPKCRKFVAAGITKNEEEIAKLEKERDR